MCLGRRLLWCLRERENRQRHLGGFRTGKESSRRNVASRVNQAMRGERKRAREEAKREQREGTGTESAEGEGEAWPE